MSVNFEMFGEKPALTLTLWGEGIAVGALRELDSYSCRLRGSYLRHERSGEPGVSEFTGDGE